MLAGLGFRMEALFRIHRRFQATSPSFRFWAACWPASATALSGGLGADHVPGPGRSLAGPDLPGRALGPLQEMAAQIAIRLMQLLGYASYRNGTHMVVGPTDSDVLVVADECSGLRILFSFVAVAVIYA